ncbi:segregation/condensation protein A [Deinococcus sp.]|uniref:segregation/condensation protein A n=1 Tax=Deinococcus sp. TaxID=47478 RepID=UPI003C7E0D42
MTALPAPAVTDWAFRVEIELKGGDLYSGDLSGLASRLRSGALLPGQVPLLRLTRDLLAWATRFAALHPETYADLLPGLAGVIALKARLLLPAPAAGPPPDEDLGDWEEAGVLEGVQALEQLGLLVQLLWERRQARQGLIPAARLDLGLPRRPGKAAGKQGLARLVKAARNAVRDVQVPLLSVERLTLQDALKALRAFARRLSIFTFGAVPAQDWGERSTYFSALLEGVKAGDFVVEQREMYGEIVVVRPGAAQPSAETLPED